MARKRSLEGYGIARHAKPAVRITLLLACGAIAALLMLQDSARGAGGDQGVLEIRIKDHRAAIGDFSRFTLNLDKIAISPKPGLKFWKAGWQDLSPSLESIDLTKYTGKQNVAVFRGPMNVGSFDAIQLKLKGIEGILKKIQRSAQIKNGLSPIQLPFSVQPQAATTIVLDLEVLDMSDHPHLSYQLGIKGWELYFNGKLVDRIPPR